MKPSLYLRIASVLTLIHCILHTLGGVLGDPPEHSAQAAIVAVMKSSTFPTMGVTRSYWDFNFGYGLSIALTLFAVAVLLWQLGSLANSCAIRPLLGTLIFFFLGFAVVAWRYFFPAAATFEVVIAVLIALAFAAAGRRKAQLAGP